MQYYLSNGFANISQIVCESEISQRSDSFFISIDLARDNWENLNRLSKNYNDRIVFILPHSEEELRQLTKEFEVQFSKTNALDSNYEINHTGNIFRGFQI